MRGFGGIVLFAIVVLLLFFRQAIDLYTDWLWFHEVGYTEVFAKIFLGKAVLGLACGGSARAADLRQSQSRREAAARLSLRQRGTTSSSFRRWSSSTRCSDACLCRARCWWRSWRCRKPLTNWELFLLFFNPTPFHLADPQFGLDLGFYVFRLPAWLAVYHWAMFALGLSFVATAAVYLLYRGIEYTPARSLSDRARQTPSAHPAWPPCSW